MKFFRTQLSNFTTRCLIEQSFKDFLLPQLGAPLHHPNCRSLFLSCFLGVTAGSGLLPLSPTLVMVQASELSSQKPQEGVIKTCTSRRIDLGAPQLTDADLKVLTRCGSEVMPQLLEALKAQNWKVKVIAAHTLGLLGTKAQSTIPTLSNLIQDENADIRFAAAQSLGEIGTEAVVPALTTALQDKDENVRVSAATAFHQIGGVAKLAKPALIDALWDGNWYVQSRVATTISKLGLEESDIPKLVKDEVSIDSLVSVIPIIYPTLQNKPENLPLFFIKASQHKDPTIHESAVIALNRISTTRPGLEQLDSITNILLKLRQEQDAKIRRGTVQALGSVLIGYETKCNLKSAEQGVASLDFGELPYTKNIARIETALIDSVQDQDSNVRQAAIKSLSSLSGFKVNSPKAVLVLLNALQDQDSNVRQEAVESLYPWQRNLEYDKSATADPLRKKLLQNILLAWSKALFDRDAITRRNAAQALGDQDSILVPTLIEIIQRKDGDVELRRSSIAILWEWWQRAHDTPEKLINVLTEVLQDHNLEIRQQAAIALIEIEKLDSESAAKLYIKGLNSMNPLTQIDATVGLKKLCSFRNSRQDCESAKPSIPLLLNMLMSSIKPLRYAAALAIAEIDPTRKEPVSTLRRMMLEENDGLVQEAGHFALTKIGSQEAMLALVEASQSSDKPNRYIRSCDVDNEINLGDTESGKPNFDRLSLLLYGLKSENTRSISAHTFQFYLSGKQGQAVTRMLTSILRKKTNEHQNLSALDNIFELKHQDLRRSAAFALGFGELGQGSEVDPQLKKEIVSALTVVVKDKRDNLNVRWMASTSLQGLGVSVDWFFKENRLPNPRKVKARIILGNPPFRGFEGYQFDRYSGRIIYNYRTGCGAGLTEIYNTLVNLLNPRKR